LRNFVLLKAVTTITCKIPDKISAHLDAVARQRRVPKSQIVREALAASFRKSKPKVSAFDLIKDACGIIKGGPKDYASHRKHLNGFGEA
jgi:predicted DNA-binding protein